MSEKPEIDKNIEELESLLHEGGAEKPPAADPDSGEDKHCFPYYDFMRSVFRYSKSRFAFVMLTSPFSVNLGNLVRFKCLIYLQFSTKNYLFLTDQPRLYLYTELIISKDFSFG